MREDWERLNWIDQAGSEIALKIEVKNGDVQITIGQIQLGSFQSIRQALDAGIRITQTESTL